MTPTDRGEPPKVKAKNVLAYIGLTIAGSTVATGIYAIASLGNVRASIVFSLYVGPLAANLMLLYIATKRTKP